MTDKALIERVARAMWEKLEYRSIMWDQATEYQQDSILCAARVALRVIVNEKRRRRRAHRIGRQV